MLGHAQLHEHRQVGRGAGTLDEIRGPIGGRAGGDARHGGAELAHQGHGFLDRHAAVGNEAVAVHVDGREHGQVARLPQAHERALEVDGVREPSQQERVERSALERACSAGVLAAVLVERCRA